MTMLVTVPQAYDHLRIDGNDDEADMKLKVEAASEAIINYLKSAADDFLNSDGEVDADSVPKVVQKATLCMVGYLYRMRDDSEGFEPGYLPPVVISLLYPLRDPALA